MPEVKEIVVVCDPFFRDIFEGLVFVVSLTSYVFGWVINQMSSLSFFHGLIEYEETIDVDLRFALPGKERQDSVYSGLQVYTFIPLMSISNEWFYNLPFVLAHISL